MVAEKVIDFYWDGHIDCVYLSVAKSGEVAVFDCLDDLLPESLLNVVSFVIKAYLFRVTSLLGLNYIWKLIHRDN